MIQIEFMVFSYYYKIILKKLYKLYIKLGCAIWCLSSGITNQVEYHIDYAELYRFRNIIFYLLIINYFILI